MMAIKGIAQYAVLTGGVVSVPDTTLTTLPGITFELLPHSDYFVTVTLQARWLDNDGFKFTWLGVSVSVNNNCSFTVLDGSNPDFGNVILCVNAISPINHNSVGTGFGQVTWVGVFRNTTAAKTTAILQAAKNSNNSVGTLQVSAGTLQAVKIV